MTQRRKRRIAVLFGGKSGEHEVSLASARSVMAALDKDAYEIVPIGITPSGRWITSGDPMALLSAGEGDTRHRLANGQRGADQCAALEPTAGRDLVPGTSRGRFPQVDVVFPVLHGTFGEDGAVQGVFELADLPYVGAGVLGSALGMDKVAQKQVLQTAGLPVVDYLAVLRSRWRREPEAVLAEIEARFGYPLFVKPANLGSSVGVSKAHDRQELVAGLGLAARFDRRLLVEMGVNAREIECSVLGNDDPIASAPGEVVPSREFYDYGSKYIDNTSELLIPAPLDEAMSARVQALAVAAFRAIDCAGMARVDFFLCRDSGELYVNELNTIPGFTQISMYPKLWEASGIPYPELLDRLIALAIERYEDKHRSETTYGFDH
jgi:D-alanine-D-alanine ligase